MSTATASYFHSASLRQRYIRELEQGLNEQRLRADEQQWLHDVVRPLVAGGPDPIRIDRLTISGSVVPFELAAALLLSHAQTDNPRMYLYTLADGVEGFNDRLGLLAALRERFAGDDADTLFEYEKIDGDPFRAQMMAIIDHQAECVGQLTAQLKLMPSLFTASMESVAEQLRVTLPHMSVDPRTHLLHVVHDSDNAGDAIPTTYTLAQAAFDDRCNANANANAVQGMKRRFLDMQGLPASETDTRLFAQVLADATTNVTHTYGKLLSAYWEEAGSDQRTRRELAIESFSGSLRQELYRASHEGSLSAITLKAMLPMLQSAPFHWPLGRDLQCSRLTVRIGDSPTCALAGTFVMQCSMDAGRSVFWFSPEHKLVSFADRAALTTYFSTVPGRAQLRPALALQDQSVLSREGEWQVGLEAVQAPLAADRVDSILALQALNLVNVMGLSSAPDATSAMVDDALDVRQLLDPRQLQLNAGRWRRNAPFNFADVWITPVGDRSAHAPASARDSLAADGDNGESHADTETSAPTSLVDYAQALDWRVERLQQITMLLPDYAEQALQQYICVLTADAVRARDIRVQWLESTLETSSDIETPGSPVSESEQLVAMDLVSMLLECVSGRRPTVLPVGAQVLLHSSSIPRRLPTDIVSHILGQVATGFAERYVRSFNESRTELRRQDDQQLMMANEALSIREDAMRLDLALAQRQTRLNSVAISMVRQVMDRPARSLRLGLGLPVTEAYAVSLSFDGNPEATLCDTMVVWQPLEQTSLALLWSCEFGWRQYDSVAQLQNTLQRILHGAHRERWLDLLGERDSGRLRTHLLKTSGNQVQIGLRRLDGHATKALQQQEVRREQQDLQRLCLRAERCRMEAGLFTRLADAAERDWPLSTMLDGLSVRIDNSIFEAMLPPWINLASVEDLKLCHDIFKRYYETSEGGKDFLFGIASLTEFTRTQLVARLKRDFPDQLLDPDEISVTCRRYVSAFAPVGELPSGVPAAAIVHSESLTHYAINRFVDIQDAALSVSSISQPHAADLLTPDYLRKLVRELDIGATYTAILRKAFAPDDANYLERQRLFVKQAPASLQLMALPDKVLGKLSTQGYEFITSVLDMPDGIAREKVGGVRVIMSPLHLVADSGMTPDPVAGVYLICPAPPVTGPVILCVIHYTPFVFREYANQAALMDDIRSDATLQLMLLERLDPEVRRRYDHNGFTEPHLPFAVGGFGDVPLRAPGPVTLELAEVRGNALQVLFSGTLKLLLDIGVSNAVSNERADQAGRTFLTTLALSQALTLLPSRLAALVTLWQSHTLFRASAVSASGHRWGQAFSEFTAALGVMATARAQAIEEQGADASGASEPATEEEERPPSGFSSRDPSLTVEQRIRLRGLEAQNVALNEMSHDPVLNIFRDKATQTPYAVVAGRVYQVRRAVEGEWSIVGADGTRGPMLVLDGNQRWQLDLGLRLRGGGGMVTRVKEISATSSAQRGLIIEASGMPEIRLLYRERAKRICEAHLRARRYLENALDNLNMQTPGTAPDSRVAHIIEDFFGGSADQQLLTRIESSIRALFDAFMDVSLSPFSSPRFVVGANRSGQERVTAFTIPLDPQQRLFLTEQFFSPPIYRLKPEAAAEGFEPGTHSQAAILIHELSHLVLDTKDIAYLESNAPYPDLMRGNTAANLRSRAQIERLHDYRLSHRTDKNELFIQDDEGQWRDVEPHDELGYSTILRITGTGTLDEAREVFLADLHKRSQVMLKNADSITLLVLRLGRKNYSVPLHDR